MKDVRRATARVHDELRGYIDYVVNEAWPEQRRGQMPINGVAWMNRVQDELFKFDPTTESQKILHAEALHAFNHLIEARRLRLDAVRFGMPAAMWAVVILGAFISLTATFLFEVDSSRLHYAMVGLLAFLMGLVVFLAIGVAHASTARTSSALRRAGRKPDAQSGVRAQRDREFAMRMELWRGTTPRKRCQGSE
jgi:hypothetical protein